MSSIQNGVFVNIPFNTANSNPGGNQEPKEHSLSFADLVQHYILYAKDYKAPSTLHRDMNRLHRLLRTFGDKKLSEITILDVEQYMQERRRTVKPATVNRELAILKHMFHRASDWEFIKSNPIRVIKLLREPEGRTRWLNNGERERLLDECKRSPNSLLYSIVLTALLTGMRKSELQRLTWDDVIFNTEIPTIIVRYTKNNKMRDIPISDRLLPLLQRLYIERCSHYVFSKPDGRPYGNWRKSFSTACRQAGINDFRFHDTRHTFASYLSMFGCNVLEIAKLTGHKTLAMVQRYVHFPNDRLKAAVDGISARNTCTTEKLKG